MFFDIYYIMQKEFHVLYCIRISVYPENISWFFGNISHVSVFWFSRLLCLDSGVGRSFQTYCWLPEFAIWLDKHDKIRMFGEIEISMWFEKTGQPWSASLLKDLSCADFRRLFEDVFEMFEDNYFKTFRGMITFTTCLAYIYFNFMCCACCGLAPILFGISVGSLHTISSFSKGSWSTKEKKKRYHQSPPPQRIALMWCANLFESLVKLQLPFAHYIASGPKTEHSSKHDSNWCH